MRADPIWALVVASGVLLPVWVWATQRRRAWGNPATWRRFGMLALLAVVAMQLTTPGDDISDSPADPAEIVLVIDRTTSMGAQDFRGGQPRMTGVAEDVAALVEHRPGARFAVVVVDNEAHLELPWTTDARAVQTLAATLGWREAGLGSGTDITVGLERALEVFQGSSRAGSPSERYLVYFGDGEQTGRETVRDLTPLAELITDALVLGYGSTAGGVMAISPHDDELVTLDGQVALSYLVPEALEQVADDLGGTYVHRTGAAAIDFWPNEVVSGATKTPHLPLRVSWLASWVLAVVVAWELWAAVTLLRVARMEVSA